MKKIEISDKNYDELKDLVKELQNQENDSQAFPYFWVPRSKKETEANNEDYDGVRLYDENCEEINLKTYYKENKLLYIDFLKEYFDEEDKFKIKYHEDIEEQWLEYILEYGDDNLTAYYYKKQDVEDHNPSLFKSDVKQYIKSNAHHLGEEPHTYANTIWRMDKMEKLIKIILQLFPLDENCNKNIKFICKREK